MQMIERAKMLMLDGDSMKAHTELFNLYQGHHDKLETSHPVMQQAHYILGMSAIGGLET